MIIKGCKSIVSEFRKSRGQIEVPAKSISNQRKSPSTPYENFIRKYSDIKESIDSLGTRDLVYYFREIAEENGYKYVISNIKKDMAIMKRLRESYSNKEICGMIEFLYESEQDYLIKDRLSINLLASQWINTIYADMKLWIDDKYTPKSQQSKTKFKGEWDKSKSPATSSIGGSL